MDDLLRGLAPVSDAAWAEIEDEARRTLKVQLAARKLVDFEGPLGWDHAAVALGRAEPVEPGPGDGVEARLRRVQPLSELRVPFVLSRRELETVGRGARDADLEPVKQAARRAALAEDRAVFHGLGGAGIRGLIEGSEQDPVSLSEDYEQYPSSVSQAIHALRTAGVEGPYAVALGPRCYQGLTRTVTRSGFPVIEHVRRLIGGPLVWAPAVDGAAVLSLRGGDFSLVVGQDFSIGYLEHGAEEVTLYLQESFTFQLLSPEAAVPLVYR